MARARRDKLARYRIMTDAMAVSTATAMRTSGLVIGMPEDTTGQLLPRRLLAAPPSYHCRVTHSPDTLPPNLPVPLDDGACDHLHRLRLPRVSLPSTGGGHVDLERDLAGPTVIFFYPRTGIPGQPPSLGFQGEDWDTIPGARGCTPQSCGFRDLYAEFQNLGVRVVAISTNTTEHQREFVERNHIPFDLLSDAELRLTRLLRLPTFEFPVESGGPTTLIKRMAWYIEGGVIVKVFYPVFPPDQNASQVLAWAKRRAAMRERPTWPIGVRPVEPRDLEWLQEDCKRFWGGTRISSLGKWYDIDALPAFVAQIGDERVGLLTYTPMERGGPSEIITLTARLEDAGVASALMAAHERAAREAGCSRLLLTTSNDNLRAIGFYQKRGWNLVAVHPGAIDDARRVEPGIPTIGKHGIPLRDELELGKPLERHG